MKAVLLFFWRVLDWLQQTVMVITSVAIVMLILIQVALRYIFMWPLMGVEELAALCGFWLYFTGSSSGARDRTQIKADLLNVFVKNQRTLFIIKTVAAFITVCLASIFAYWCVEYFQWSLRTWERTPALLIPMVYAQASLLINAFLMVLYFFIEFLDYGRQAMGYEPLRFTGLADVADLTETQAVASGE